MPQLQDANFWHSVLLVVDQNRDGAFGFVLNRPSEIPLAAVLKGDQSAAHIPAHIPTWTGGPVGTDNGLILTDRIYQGANEDDIIGDSMLLTSEETALTALIEYGEAHHADDVQGSRYPYRFLVGYAGWGPGQLDEEVRQGSWIQLDYDHSLVFDTPWSTMWDKAISTLGVSPNVLTAPPPSDYLN